MISSESGFAALSAVLGQDLAQVGVVPIQWARYLAQVEQPAPFVAHFAAGAVTLPAAAAIQNDFRQQLTEAPRQNRQKMLQSHLQTAVATVLKMTKTPSPKAGFSDLGMDSLMTLELKKRLEKSLQLTLPATVAFEYPSIEALTAYLAEELLPAAAPTPDDEPVEASPPLLAANDEGAAALDALSAEELARLLAGKLESIN
ncbi:MAG: acyl carrier protein [Caldilineaceae bacterium]